MVRSTHFCLRSPTGSAITLTSGAPARPLSTTAMPDDESLLIYGSTGYTGRLVAQRAVERGLRPILAGRRAGAVAAHAAELGLGHRTFALDDPAAVDAGLAGVRVVLHCAGPFSRTYRQMADGCLRARAHYLDITGEIAVFEGLARRTQEAAAAGVMLLPGVGFDVVPSDCLAAHLKRRLPSATRLALAFRAAGGVSRGTASTMLEGLSRPGAVRRDGRIVPVPAAWRTRRDIDFGDGRTRAATTIPWGDVSTAYHSTGIGNVEVYAAMGRTARRAAVASRYLGWLLGAPSVRRLLERRVRSAPPGPDADARARGESRLWGEATDDAGRRAVSRLRCPEGYALTALTAVAAVERALAGHAPPGFQTPSLAYGADFILEIAGVVREDVA
jgi:short subunit dehydrogenase-like uncharacterized protein